MSNADTFLTPGQQIRPPVNKDIAIQLLKKLYGMRATSVTELNGYDDRNYHVLCEERHANPFLGTFSKHGYVLKVVNSLDSEKIHVIDAQNEMLLFLNERGIACPKPVKNVNGMFYSQERLNDENRESKHVVRLLIYRPGELLHRVSVTAELLRKVGYFTAKLDETLKDFTHPGYMDHKTLWMLSSVPKLRKFSYAVANTSDRQLAHDVISRFEKDVLEEVSANKNELEVGIIHGDLNEQNLVMSADGKDIVAVIDFGDSQKAYLIFELAIVLCYMILQAGDIAMGKCVVEGYESVRKLNALEKRILKISVCARMCQSLVMGAYSHLHDQQNEYLLLTQKSGWTLLKKLWPMKQEDVSKAWGLVDS